MHSKAAMIPQDRQVPCTERRGYPANNRTKPAGPAQELVESGSYLGGFLPVRKRRTVRFNFSFARMTGVIRLPSR